MDDSDQRIHVKQCKTEQKEISGGAIERAFKENRTGAIQYLLENGLIDLNKTIFDRMKPLEFVCRKGLESIARLLIEKGANVDAQDKEGQTLLHFACRYGHESIARLLIEKGANADAQDKYRQTPLHFACYNGRETIAGLLIEKGANVDAQDEDRRTPLRLTCANGYESIARLLVEKRAAVDVQDNDGHAPLHWACVNGHDSIVRLLIEKGARVDISEKHGATPLSLAYSRGHKSIARLLIANGARISTELFERFPNLKVDHRIQVTRMYLHWICTHFPDSFFGKDYLPRDMYRLIVRFYIRSEEIDELFSDNTIKE